MRTRISKVINRILLLKIGENAELDIVWWGEIQRVLTGYKNEIRDAALTIYISNG